WRGTESVPYLFDLVNPSAFFLCFGFAGVEYDAIAGLERRLEADGDAVAAEAGDFAEVDAAFFSKPGVDQFLVVDAAEPAGIEAAREGHLQGVFPICDFRFTI